MMTLNNPVEADEIYAFKQAFKSCGFSLMGFHGIFYRLFDISRIIPSYDIDTINVSINEEYECIEMRVNPTYFLALSEYQRQFVLCHEMHHILWGHLRNVPEGVIFPLYNAAQDLVINEALLKELNFDRARVDPENDYIWHDTIFPEELTKDKYPNGIPTGRSSEYYYEILKDLYPDVENPPQNAEGGSAQGGEGSEEGDGNSSGSPFGEGNNTVDDHSKNPSEGNGDKDPNNNSDKGKDISKSEAQKAISKLSPEEQNSLQKMLNRTAGKEPSSQPFKFKTERIAPDNRFRKIIRHITGARKKCNGNTWLREDTRLTGDLDNSSFRLPAKGPAEVKNKKPEIWLFVDVSGSCYHMKDEFWKAAMSIPRSVYDVRMFIFSTRVEEVINNNFRGGGGTNFQCIENYLNKQPKYPNYVWVFTDGEDSKPNIKYPKRWYWFLDDYYVLYGIPEESPKYLLSNLKKIKSKK